MFPERSDATRLAVAAQGPRLLGVPVPARAFGFAPGWQLSPNCWSTIDLRDRAVVIRPLMCSAATTSKRVDPRSHGPAGKANSRTYAIDETTQSTIQVEVAAA